jgi:hypothetical protein
MRGSKREDGVNIEFCSLSCSGRIPVHTCTLPHTHTHLQMKRRESCPFSNARVASLMPMHRHFRAYLWAAVCWYVRESGRVRVRCEKARWVRVICRVKSWTYRFLGREDLDPRFESLLLLLLLVWWSAGAWVASRLVHRFRTVLLLLLLLPLSCRREDAQQRCNFLVAPVRQ